MLQIRLLGQFDVRATGKRIEIPSRAGQSLLAYLLLTAGTQQRRERLAGLLWPDTSDEKARHNLRTELWRIRKALGSRDDADHDYLLSEDLTITFNPEAQLWLDVNQFQRPTSPDGSLDDLIGQLALYQGELLPGFYDDWIVLERERLQAVFERDIKRLIERLCQEQRWTTVLEWSERWIALGQTPEPAYRALMAAYVALGDRAKSVATFERCRAALERDLGVEPSPETQSLYDRLLQGEAIGSVDLSATQIAPAHVRLTEESPAPGEPPFKGLQYFDEADADLFFGRELLTAKLIEHLRKSNFLAVIVGASGSGKSSIVRAGLIPALKRDLPLADGTRPPDGCSQWLVHVITPTAHPLEALATALTRDSESVTATATLLDDLAREPRSLALFSKLLLGAHCSPHLLLVIDQFEELFTLCRDEFEREAFIDNLLSTLTPAPLSLAASRPATSWTREGRGDGGEDDITLILTLRADFYAHLAQYPELREAVAQQQEYIGPMTADELRRAIEEPAKRGGWEFEPGLVDLMLRDVGDEPGALPLLSHGLLETWQRRSGRTMTLKGYADSGGVRGAIAYTAESVYQQLSTEQQDLARHIFLELTELGEGTEDTRRRIRINEVVAQSDQVRPLLTTLADARLLTTGEETVEVAHEALIREWPRLRDWLNEDREGLRLHRHVTEAAHDWELLEYDAGALYRGARLSQANEWATTNPDALSASQRAFLAASNELEQREAVEREALRQRELQAALTLAETQQRSAIRLRRRNRVIIGAGLAALFLAVLAGLFGIQSNQNATRADQNAAQAQSNLNVAQANAATAQAEAQIRATAQAKAVSEAQARATQQAVAEANFIRAEAQRLAAEANVALKSGASSELVALLALRSLNLQYSPQGDAALTGAAALDYPLHIFAADGGAVFALALSPDGKYILSGNDAKVTRLLEVQTGKEVHRFVNEINDVWGIVLWVAFSPDSRYAVTHLSLEGDKFIAQLWDVETGQLVRQFDSPIYCHMSFFSRDGKELWMGCWDAKARIYDWLTGQLLRTLSLPVQDGQEILWLTSDGRYALTRTLQGYTARLWNLEGTIAELGAFPYSSNVNFDPNAFALSPDAKYVLVGDQDGTTHLYETGSGKEIRTIEGSGSVQSVTFSPDSKMMLVGDSATRLLDVRTGEELYRLPPTDAANAAVFSPDGNSVILGAGLGSVRVWDIRPQPEFPVFRGHTDAVSGVAFSPDGKYLATGGHDGLRLWNAKTGQPLRVFSDTHSVGYGVKFSSDGRYLLSGNYAGVASLWDVDTGAEVQRLVLTPTVQIYTVDFSPDGKFILTGGSDRVNSTPSMAHVRNIQTGDVTLWLKTHVSDSLVTRVTFSPDGQYILTAHGNPSAARLWDAKTGQEIRQFPGHIGWVNGAVFSPDGQTIATANDDGTVCLWDTKTGKEIRQFIGHSGVVWSVTFSRDGRYLASASADGTARLWDVQTGQELRRYTGHGAGVENVAFSPDGKTIATVSDDGTARLWDVDYHTTMQYLCSRLLRDLSDDERKQYGITDTTPTCPQR
jgi:WD40 repeat protein/DNA-binding SARP family transcriptional activator